MTQEGFTFSPWSTLHVFKIAPKMVDEPIPDLDKIKWADVPVAVTVTIEYGNNAGGNETLRKIAYLLVDQSGSHVCYGPQKAKIGSVVSPISDQPDKDV